MITNDDTQPVTFAEVISFLKKSEVLTQSHEVQMFEKLWSKWLGVKYSVFVNSGSSANLLSIQLLKLKYPQGGEVIVPPLTWSSDIASLIHCGFKPVFVDINPQTLGMDISQVLEKLNDQTRAVFLTHVLGYNALEQELLDELNKRNIPLIEDCCEAHGATYEGRRVGSIGWASNFSFYYAHHLTTIEGGMICTNNKKLYEILIDKLNPKISKNIGKHNLSSIGIVTGATYPKELEHIRKKLPYAPFLIPGFGKQGGSIEDARRGLLPDKKYKNKFNSGIINSSRNGNILES